MRSELVKLINAERKYKRELKDLRDLKQKISRQVKPDVNILKMLDLEIQSYLEQSK